MADDSSHDRDTDLAHLRRLVSNVNIAMLTTVDASGALRSRPMTTQAAEEDGTVWFFSAGSSAKVGELEQRPEVNLSYADPERGTWVSAAGRAQVVHDRARMAQLWRETYRRWFPRGLDDPDLVLLRVTIERAETWDAEAARMVPLFRWGRGAVIGDAGGTHGTIHLGGHSRLDPGLDH